MIQATTFQKARMPLLGIAALLLAALLLIVAAQPPLTLTGSNAAAAPTVATTMTATHTETGRCGDGAYVTGDLAGDTSPAEIYLSMCGAR
jgi:hypothetical protein